MEILAFLLVGVCVGTFGTLVGLGGGLILVPLFMFTMLAPNGDTFTTVQQVVGTSLFCVACNAVSGAYAYMKQKRIMFRAAIPFALATIPGAFCGSYVSKYFTGPGFSIAFGCLLAVLGCFMYWKSNTKRATARPEDFDPETAPFNLWLGVVLTFGVGFLSTIFGIGGGIIDVPMMIFILGFPAQIATASSTFILMTSALVGTISHGMMGHIVWMPAICIGIGCVLGAQLGAMISKKSKPKIIVVILSITMVLMGCNLVWRGTKSPATPAAKPVAAVTADAKKAPAAPAAKTETKAEANKPAPAAKTEPKPEAKKPVPAAKAEQKAPVKAAEPAKTEQKAPAKAAEPAKVEQKAAPAKSAEKVQPAKVAEKPAPVAAAAAPQPVTITLDADVAKVFTTPESVNAALRQLIGLGQLLKATEPATR